MYVPIALQVHLRALVRTGLIAFKGVKMSMLEFEASYLPFERLFKNLASDMTIFSTPSLLPYRVIL